MSRIKTRRSRRGHNSRLHRVIDGRELLLEFFDQDFVYEPNPDPRKTAEEFKNTILDAKSFLLGSAPKPGEKVFVGDLDLIMDKSKLFMPYPSCLLRYEQESGSLDERSDETQILVRYAWYTVIGNSHLFAAIVNFPKDREYILGSEGVRCTLGFCFPELSDLYEAYSSEKEFLFDMNAIRLFFKDDEGWEEVSERIAKRGHRSFILEVLTDLADFLITVNSSGNFIAKTYLASENKKPIKFLEPRIQYVIIDKNKKKLALRDRLDDTKKKKGGSYSIKSRVAHNRRGHQRVLRSDYYKNKQGQTVWVKEAWIGPSKWKHGNSIYEIVDLKKELEMENKIEVVKEVKEPEFKAGSYRIADSLPPINGLGRFVPVIDHNAPSLWERLKNWIRRTE